MFTEKLLLGTLFGIGLGSILFFTLIIALIISLVIFIYKAFALYTIAKKLKSNYAFLAWIPIVQFFLYPILAEEDWGWGLIALIPIAVPLLFIPFSIIPFVNLFLLLLITFGTLILVIFKTYWIWKIFERRNYNGALSLLTLINLVDLVVLGIVAWKDVKSTKVETKKKTVKTKAKPVKKTVSKKLTKAKPVKKTVSKKLTKAKPVKKIVSKKSKKKIKK